MAAHRATPQRIFIAFLIVCGVHAVQAGKILIATTPIGKSHLMNLMKIATEIEHRGNTVMVILSSLEILRRMRLL